MLLLLAAFLCVLQFVVAVSYRFRRGRHPAKEIATHLAALAMVAVFVLVSGMLNKPEFVVFGVVMAVVMAIYYAFTWAEGVKAS
jgi:drug/metabolite transporter (DMT)-like permease